MVIAVLGVNPITRLSLNANEYLLSKPRLNQMRSLATVPSRRVRWLGQAQYQMCMTGSHETSLPVNRQRRRVIVPGLHLHAADSLAFAKAPNLRHRCFAQARSAKRRPYIELPPNRTWRRIPPFVARPRANHRSPRARSSCSRRSPKAVSTAAQPTLGRGRRLGGKDGKEAS